MSPLNNNTIHTVFAVELPDTTPAWAYERVYISEASAELVNIRVLGCWLPSVYHLWLCPSF
jgi:hypothetical protein